MQAVMEQNFLSPEHLAAHRAAVLDFISAALFRQCQSEGERA